MKTQIFFLLLSFAASESFSQANKSDHRPFINVHHYRNHVSLTNFDGTRSTIYVNGNSATLINADGTQSTISFCGNSSTLIAIDGSSSSISHNRSSSTVFNSDGTQLIIGHMQTTSSCSTENGKHTIRHTFGNIKEKRLKNRIDVLIHTNWLIQKKAIETAAEDELNEEHEN